MNEKTKIHFIDCGGNIGQSVAYAIEKYGDRELKIDTFEPYDKNYEVIEKTYFADDRVVIHRNAVWIEEVIKRFYLQSWGARTASSLHKGKRSTSVNEYVDVGCIDLCEWITNSVSSDDYNILKIDVEGSEYAILEKIMNEGLDSRIDEWLIEWTPKAKLPNALESYMNKIQKRFLDKKYNYTDWGFHV